MNTLVATQLNETPDAFGTLELPLALIDLDDVTVSAISWAALRYFDAAPSAIVGQPVANIVDDDDDRGDALLALQAMRAGAIDSYVSHRAAGARQDPDRVVTEWVRRLRFGDRRLALVQVAEGTGVRQSPLATYLGREPLTMVVGTTDADWVVTSVSTEVEALLGITPSEAVGRRFLCSVEQSEVRTLLHAGVRTRGEDSVAFRLVLQDRLGQLTPACCVLTSLADSTELCFIVMREADLSPQPDMGRLAKLEQHLRRIAVEVEDSGVLARLTAAPTPAGVTRLAGLTDRQLEVLSRLIRGERVPAIAKALFVSQSTVRNHLAGIFKHFRVHSQPELLARLASHATHAAVGLSASSLSA